MVDIRLLLGGLRFSVRVALLCVREGRLLVNVDDGLGFAFLPGGALGTGEDVVECAAREWAEETGLAPGPMRVVAVVENFFGGSHGPQHEIGFYLRMSDPPEVADGASILDSATGRLRWLPLAEVAAYPVLPTLVLDLLEVPDGEVRHLVQRG